MALTTNQINDIAQGIIDRLNMGEPQIPMFGLVDADTGTVLPPRTDAPVVFSGRVSVQEIAFWQPLPAAAA